MLPNLVIALAVALSALLSSVAAPIAARPGQPLAATTYELRFSQSPARSSSMALLGKQVSGNIYVFVNPSSGVTGARFYLDDTNAAGTPIQTEGSAPFDFAGGSADAANPYDTTKLSNAWHTITAVLDLSTGKQTKISSNFLVSNGSAVAATATSAPATRDYRADGNARGAYRDECADCHAGGGDGHTWVELRSRFQQVQQPLHPHRTAGPDGRR